MAVPGMCMGLFGRDADEPLRPADLPSRAALEALWDQTEAEVAASAWGPAGGELPRALGHRSHTDRGSHPAPDSEAALAASVWED